MTEAEITQLHAQNRALYQTQPLDINDYPHLLPPTFERHIIISDYHHRNYVERDWVTGDTRVRTAHDPRAMAVVERFMQEWEPTHIHYNGDMMDFHAISRWCKAAPGEDELSDSILAIRKLFAYHRSMFPRAEMNYLLGNHEVRWQNFIAGNAAALGGLKELTYGSILGAKELRLNIYPYKRRLPILPGVFEITHGDKVRNKSGASAHAMLDKGISGVSGHTHRLGMVYRTNRAGAVVWAENGCLCDLEPDYATDVDWQQGFSIVFVDRANGRFHMEQLPIINGRIVHAGRVYEAA